VLHNNLSQMVQCIDEIGRCTQEIATGAETQGNSVGKATSSVEQIASNVVTVNSKAEQARESFLHARSLAEETLRDVRELMRSLERMRINAESSEKKLRALGDHSHEISAIVETIGEIASRTDMLALNASIESVRAGEHGKGFAVVAEEVRKLAEQATHATREVAGLLETIRLEAQESISGISQERVQIENEVARVTTAGEALGKIGDLADDSAARVQEVLTSAQQQSRLVEDVLSTVDLIRNVTKMSRKRSERACWMVNAISKNTRAFGNSLSPLRRCSDGYVDELEADSTSDFPLSMGAAEMRADQRTDQRPGDEDLMDDARDDLNSLNLDSDPDSAGNLRSRDLADVH
jgi:methyl-accepting chemotaxis protein